ncbi:hypothetical protein DFH05DRAFT_1470971 [Lentinula detonsa]|uniref:Uncharacterized protein n=1 Tax=Lentinula detonsa TaxID=2804962 RepID=A0A9W8PCN0_9AGAR|nr:hypothetical protein DFH05DRAFT_1470937 [Lentinula detonsa]KAJ3751335.1 hypothetical protein DFH05DRAFT_1470971 [Lentinula detonsa]
MRLRALKRDDRNARARERDRRKGQSLVLRIVRRRLGLLQRTTNPQPSGQVHLHPKDVYENEVWKMLKGHQGLGFTVCLHQLPRCYPPPLLLRGINGKERKETQDSEAPRRYSISLRRSISHSRSRAIRPSRSPIPDAGIGSITPTSTATTSHPNTSMSPMGKISSSLSSGWRRSKHLPIQPSAGEFHCSPTRPVRSDGVATLHPSLNRGFESRVCVTR